MKPAWMPALPRETRDTLFTLALVGWIALPQAAHRPWWCTALVLLVLAWRGLLAVLQRPLPSRWWLAALLLAVLAATRHSHGSLVGQEAGVTLLLSLLALKTLELRARRDALVVFFLGFFTMLTGFIESQSLPMAASVLVGVLGLLTALINAHRPVGLPSLQESAALALRLSLLGLPVMVALFLFFPRFAPLWAIPTDPGKGRSGLSSSMTVGHVAELAMDESIAFRVKFEGPPPPQHQLYFRGPVLSLFDGQRWTARGADADGFPGFTGPPPRDLQVRGTPVAYEITLEPSHQPWLLTLDATAEAPRLPERWRSRQTPELQWLTRPIGERLRYRVQSHLDYSYGLAGRDGRPRRDFSFELQLPQGFNPRTQALARELLAGTADGQPEQLVQAALQQLRSGGYVYTLQPGRSGTHSADEFWFETRAGFCEHIASAFVVLLRAGGVPARIVTGFQGGERNAVDGYWTVRNADAHAWAEVWLPERGWVRVDPTSAVMPARVGVGQYQRLRSPPGLVGRTIGNFNPQLLARLRTRWEAMNNRWNQWVLGHDQERQLQLLRRLGFSQPDWTDLGKVLAALVVLASLLVLGWSRWERIERDPWLRLLQQVRLRLQQAGLSVPAQAAPRQLARLVEDSALPPALRAALLPWLLQFEQWRYAAPASPGAPSLATLRRQFKSLPWPRSA